MSLPSNIKISLQSLSETKIQEIAYDGRETFIQPLSMSESLTDLANRIDFLAEDDSAKDEEDESVAFQPKQWPWESIRTHIQRALIEMNVLTDVLSIAQNKPRVQARESQETSDANRYMMIDYVAKDREPSKLGLQMFMKKRSLSAASKVLLNGADRLTKARDESSTQTSYHSDLLKLRQCWRIRRVGEKILGDLSYRTTGSDFWHSGIFEVIKKAYDEIDSVTDDERELLRLSSHAPPRPAPVKVIVSSDLRGYAALSVKIVDRSSGQRSVTSQSSVTFQDVRDSLILDARDPIWQRKLCNAQNLLFCRELFARLSKEAVQNKIRGTVSPVVVVGDALTTRIFPDTELCVELLFSRTLPTPNRSSDDEESVFSLKHSMMQLLLEYYAKRLNIPSPHPTTAVLGINDRMRVDAVEHGNLPKLTTSTEQNNLSFVDTLINMAKHFEVRRRLSNVVKMVASRFEDPTIQAHWSLVGNPCESSVQITVANVGFESCYKSAVLIVAKPDEIKVLQREGRGLTLSVDPSEVRNYLLSLIALHQLSTVQVLAKTLGWSVMHFDPHSSLGLECKVKNRGALAVSSPTGLSNVSVGCNENVDGQIEYDVHVQYTIAHDKLTQGHTELITTMDGSMSLDCDKYQALGGMYNKVDWRKLHGRHFVPKMESLLTRLAF